MDILDDLKRLNALVHGDNAGETTLTKAADEITSLRNQLAECQKDAERIEWLEQEHRKHGEIYFRRYGLAWTKLFTISTQHMRQKPNIREAIDAAKNFIYK